jgi:predicted permease
MGWRRFWRRGRRDEDLALELQSYLEHEADRRLADGTPPDDARAAAMKKLGNTTRIREQVYDANSMPFLEWIAKDVRYALRMLAASPGFASAAILTLALGIGANTAIFQLLDALRLRSLPVPRPNELVEVVVDGGNRGYGVSQGAHVNLTNPLWEALRTHQKAFSGMFAWGTLYGSELPVGRGENVRHARGIWVSGELFPVLGVTPFRGRLIAPADDRRGCAPGAVVVSHAYWQSQLGAAESTIGAPIVIGDRSFQVVGVTPPVFTGLEVGQRFDIALPICTAGLWGDALDQRHYWWLVGMGRVKTGWTVDQAAEHVRTLSATLFDQLAPPGYANNANWKKLRLTAVPGGRGISQWREQYSTSLWLLLGITGLVLLIACANLANLMLARAAARQREFAVRLAIGASRFRIATQSLVESLVLALAGALIGTGLAMAASRAIVAFLATEDNGLHLDLPLDWRMLAFTTAITLVTCMLCGLAPALRLAHTEPGDVMKAGGRGLTSRPEGSRFQRLLVVTQIAVSLVLVVGALLFARSFHKLLSVDAGFRQDGILFAFCDLTPRNLRPAAFSAAKEAILDRIRALPQIEGAASSTKIPLTSGSWTMGVRIGGRTAKDDWSKVSWVSPGFFHALDVPVLAGRDFTRADNAMSPKVMLVNETFVSRYLKDRPVIGTRVRTAQEPGYPETDYEIIGVVRDVKYSNLREEIPPTSFVPDAQFPDPRSWMAVVVRTSGDAGAASAAIRRAFSAEGVRNSQVIVLRQQVREGLARERLMSWLSGVFGVIAGLLAAIGLYGVMSYGVARRSNEIAIRMALGAAQRDVLSLMLLQAGRLLVVGLAAGTVAALAAARAARTLLFGLEPDDPATFAGAAVLLAIVALLAAYLPAARASRLSPLEGLRSE